MKQFLFFCFLLAAFKFVGQSTSHSQHESSKITVSDMINVMSNCYYLERQETSCCSELIKITGVDAHGQIAITNTVGIGGWNYFIKTIKTNDNHLLLLTHHWHSCDVGNLLSQAVKIDISGNISSVQDVGYATDVTQHIDQSYYFVNGSSLIHYSPAFQYDSTFVFTFSGIQSVTALQSGRLLLNATGKNLEITTTGSITLQQATSSSITKFIESSSGHLYSKTTTGTIEKYDTLLMLLGSTHTSLPTNFKITDFAERHDSIFVTGVDTLTQAPFYRILDQNLNSLYLSQSTYKNIIPKSILIKGNAINISASGSSAYFPDMTFKSTYHFPLTGAFSSAGDIGICGITVNSSQFIPSWVVGNYNEGITQLDCSITVKNFGNAPVHSFWLNYYNQDACSDFHQLYTNTIPTNDSVVLPPVSFYGPYLSVPINSQPTDIYNISLCLFTTVPDSLNDVAINNDRYCKTVSLSNIASGIKENSSVSSDIHLFPNPFRNSFQIESEFKINELEIYNAIGVLLKTTVVNEKSFTLDNSALEGGIYFIKLNTEKGTITKKVVKE